MAFPPDPRIDAARDRSMREVLEKLPLADLINLGGELTGPCPRTGCGGDDRFSVNINKGVWRCRVCDPRGGDALALVQMVCDCDFMGAVAFLEGERGVELDPIEVARRKKAKRDADAKAAADEAQYRAWAKRKAEEIWHSAAPFRGTSAAVYLAARNVDLSPLPFSFACLRFLPTHPYIKKIAGENRELHRGPALIAAIQGPDGRFMSVHQTWFNPDEPGKKTVIVHPETGKPLASKLVQGSSKGGAIRLTGLSCAPCLVMGEGIETTGTALVADAVPGASYWAGISLPNMGGKQEGRNTGVPLLSDERAFIPPDLVERLMLIEDGDSEPKMTRANLNACARRALHANPRRRCQIVRAGVGVDLNDLVKGP